MELDKIIRKRKSVRSFTATNPSWKYISDAIESTLQNPFAGNHNNLKFLIIEDEEIIKKISKIAEQSWISQAGILIVVCSNDAQLESLYGERGRIYSRQQAGAAIQTLLLKLVDLGLSSCWVGAFTDEILKEALNIPQHIQIEAIIPVGYENPEHKKSKPHKKELENSIFWENWNNQHRPALFKEPKA